MLTLNVSVLDSQIGPSCFASHGSQAWREKFRAVCMFGVGTSSSALSSAEILYLVAGRTTSMTIRMNTATNTPEHGFEVATPASRVDIVLH